MSSEKRDISEQESNLHPRNQHRKRYNFGELIKSNTELSKFVIINKYGGESIDFFNPDAVMNLNKALLKQFYDIDYWEIPKGFLAPPIPSRANYIHYIADLLQKRKEIFSKSETIKRDEIKCLDIGIGANCVYPIIGNKEYGWSFVGSDIDKKAIESARKIINNNPNLKSAVELRFQENSKDIFSGIIKKDEFFDITICNPPFHESKDESQKAAKRKARNLQNKKTDKPILNFGGTSNELWCDGGEKQFITNMIVQSRLFANSCYWFTTLVSKQSNLKAIYASLKKVNAVEIKTIEMKQGNKISRIVAWTFLSKRRQERWMQKRFL